MQKIVEVDLEDILNDWCFCFDEARFQGGGKVRFDENGKLKVSEPNIIFKPDGERRARA